MLCPTMRDGQKCVILDKNLAQSNPAMYESILKFARNNKLQITEDPGVAPDDK